MEAATLVTEVTRYLEAIELFQSLGLIVKWIPEADEVASSEHPGSVAASTGCECCAGPLVRINGQHVCLQTRSSEERNQRCQP
jgi:hypothetical protein